MTFQIAPGTYWNLIFPSDAEALEKDHGETISFLNLTARRTGTEGEDFYDPALGGGSVPFLVQPLSKDSGAL